MKIEGEEGDVPKKINWTDPDFEGKVETKNGFKIRDLAPYDPDNLMERLLCEGKNPLHGKIGDAAYPYGIWSDTGETLYIHNFRKKENLSDFDLVLKG